MNVKQLFADEDAVSPVIGVILMVAITVILAAVIGTFVLGLGENVQTSAPQANFQFEYGSDTAGSGADNGVPGTVDIAHTGGEDIDPSNVEVKPGSLSTVSTFDDDWSTNPISTGSTENITTDTAAAGETIRVIWTSPSGGNSNTIGQSTIPNV